MATDWTSPFVIYRVSPTGALEEVFVAHDLKKAVYWLTYIAEPGDVLCRTPAHAQHPPEARGAQYWSHKAAGGKVVRDESAWRGALSADTRALTLPETPLGQ